MSVFSGCGEVLRTPGALRAFLPALFGRLSVAVVSLALLFTVHASSGSFAAAGAATGIFGIAGILALLGTIGMTSSAPFLLRRRRADAALQPDRSTGVRGLV